MHSISLINNNPLTPSNRIQFYIFNDKSDEYTDIGDVYDYITQFYGYRLSTTGVHEYSGNLYQLFMIYTNTSKLLDLILQDSSSNLGYTIQSGITKASFVNFYNSIGDFVTKIS